MIRTYKRKLNLTVAQEQRLSSWIGACRVVYNLGLEVNIHTYRSTGLSTHKYALCKQLKGLRADISWIEDVPFQVLDTVIFRLDRAYKSFFTGSGFPKFASKKTFKSIVFKKIKAVDTHSVTLQKIGRLRMVKDARIVGIPKTAQIIKEPTGFFICIQCEDVPQKFNSENQAIGLDMGISNFCIDSNGGFISNPRHFKRYERQLKIENRSLVRKRKGSNSWMKQCKRLNLLHHKIGNVRRDFLHKHSTAIAKSNKVVYLEDLNVSGMSKNRKLSKHILDCGWGQFRTLLSYKTKVVAINPAFTSQACNQCGSVDKKSRINQSEYCCTSCGHIDHADINAAKNIKERGTLLDRQREALVCA